MNNQNFKIGQDVTLISKGIVHSSYGKDYVSEDLVGSTAFMKVTKIGRDYLYGIHFRFDDGKREDFYSTDKVNPEEYVILEGYHPEYDQKHRIFNQAVQDWEKAQREHEYIVDREQYEQKRVKMDEWKKAHPRPTTNLDVISKVCAIGIRG